MARGNTRLRTDIGDDPGLWNRINHQLDSYSGPYRFQRAINTVMERTGVNRSEAEAYVERVKDARDQGRRLDEGRNTYAYQNRLKFAHLPAGARWRVMTTIAIRSVSTGIATYRSVDFTFTREPTRQEVESQARLWFERNVGTPRSRYPTELADSFLFSGVAIRTLEGN